MLQSLHARFVAGVENRWRNERRSIFGDPSIVACRVLVHAASPDRDISWLEGDESPNFESQLDGELRETCECGAGCRGALSRATCLRILLERDHIGCRILASFCDRGRYQDHMLEVCRRCTKDSLRKGVIVRSVYDTVLHHEICLGRTKTQAFKEELEGLAF